MCMRMQPFLCPREALDDEKFMPAEVNDHLRFAGFPPVSKSFKLQLAAEGGHAHEAFVLEFGTELPESIAPKSPGSTFSRSHALLRIVCAQLSGSPIFDVTRPASADSVASALRPSAECSSDTPAVWLKGKLQRRGPFSGLTYVLTELAGAATAKRVESVPGRALIPIYSSVLELVSDLRELAGSSGAVELEGPIKNLLARCEALGLDQSKDSCEKLVEHVQASLTSVSHKSHISLTQVSHAHFHHMPYPMFPTHHRILLVNLDHRFWGPPSGSKCARLITSVRATCLASGSRRSWAIAESSMARQSHGRKCAPFATWSKRAGCATLQGGTPARRPSAT